MTKQFTEKTDATPEIPCFSIPTLMDMSQHEAVAVPHFSKQLIALCDTSMDMLRFPCRFDAIIISLCTEGECTILSNLREYTLTKGSMFFSGPKSIIQVKSTQNLRSDVLVVSPELLGETQININNLISVLFEFGDHPCLSLPEGDIRAMHNLIAQIANEIQTSTQTSFTPEVIGGLVMASIAKVGDILVRYMEQHPSMGNNRKHDRAEEYFREFTQLLAEYYKQERSVGFYAQKMCITPKYLTTLIKRISGKSVSEWVEDFVVLEAKTLLKYSNMSIQEVAYYLNFPNQSFFGSYFKRNTGISPSQYKLQ